MSRLVGSLASGCGSKISSVQSELGVLESVVDSLRDVVYGSSKQNSTSPSTGARAEVVPTVASRVAFPDKLLDFDPSPFLPEPYLTAFRDPSKILQEPLTSPPALPLTTARAELWHLFFRWDRANRLCLALEDEVDPSHACNLFCLAKSDGELRQIIDRRPRNRVEADPPSEGPKMGHASSFVDILIPPNGCVRVRWMILGTFTMPLKLLREGRSARPSGLAGGLMISVAHRR